MLKKLCLLFHFAVFGSLSVCLAQANSQNLHIKQGTIIHEEERTASNGRITVIGYRLEQVRLAKPWGGGHKGEPSPLESIFRVVIKTSNDLPKNLYSVWLDENQINAYQTRPNEVVILIYTKTLPNGIIKLGLSSRVEADGVTRFILPGTLYVPPEFATPNDEIEAAKPVITLRRLSPKNPTVELAVKLSTPTCNDNSFLTIEIDSQELNTFCSGGLLSAWIPEEIFTRLRNGADIIIKRGAGRNSKVLFTAGQLNKTSLNTSETPK